MAAGYIYILKNKSFDNFVVKIGLTTRSPDVRASEIYTGATGVPERFDIVFACSVADCKAAEAKIHSRLSPYRINSRREFFQISPIIAKRIVLDSCQQINLELNISTQPLIVTDQLEIIEHPVLDATSSPAKFMIKIDNLVRLPIGTTKLSDSQLGRLSILSMIFNEVYPLPENHWHDTFSRDKIPERELLIWEHLAKAFMKIDQVKYFDYAHKKEAYKLLLMRSMRPTHEVIKAVKLEFFTENAALQILNGYELPHSPIIVTRRSTS